MRAIQAEKITKAVKQLFLDCNYYIGNDIMEAFRDAYGRERSEVAKKGSVIGPAGPTSSCRMDKYTPSLLEDGLVGMMGKGARSD